MTARKNAVASLPIAAASMEKSFPIEGMATISAETMNGARKDPPADISRTYFLEFVSIRMRKRYER